MARFETSYVRHKSFGIILWTRVLPLLGILCLIERAATYYHWASHPISARTFSVVSSFGLRRPPAVHSAPKSSTGARKAIVIASIEEESTRWVEEYFPDWETQIYIVDDAKAKNTVFKNSGREASVYLSYIINNYWNLPDYIVFHHGQRYQWHNDDPMFDSVPILRNLQLDAVGAQGYLSLRCVHAPGCMGERKPNFTGEDIWPDFSHSLARRIGDFVPEVEMPRVIGATCCAEFAVSKAQVHTRSLREYENMREWLWHSDLPDAIVGRLMEYIWHMIFGKPPVFCPSAPDCYCQNFGLCDLKCPKAPYSCEGRYMAPPPLGGPGSGLPEDWPHKGQGQGWLPKDKWWEEVYPPSEYDGFRLRANITRS